MKGKLGITPSVASMFIATLCTVLQYNVTVVTELWENCGCNTACFSFFSLLNLSLAA